MAEGTFGRLRLYTVRMMESLFRTHRTTGIQSKQNTHQAAIANQLSYQDEVFQLITSATCRIMEMNGPRFARAIVSGAGTVLIKSMKVGAEASSGNEDEGTRPSGAVGIPAKTLGSC
jgi:hypothetical protein